MYYTEKLSRMPYAQATVVHNDDGIYLVSYSTVVARINNDGAVECYGLYSATTRKHISAFARQFTDLSYYDFKAIAGLPVQIDKHTGEKII